MPIYCFKADDGEIFERFFSMDNVPKRIHIDGKTAERSLVSELLATRSPPPAGWPITCIASGVHASQADDLRKYLAKKGVKTEVNSDGNPIYISAAHRRRALGVRGIHDNASFC